jgi:hypothetical protein
MLQKIKIALMVATLAVTAATAFAGRQENPVDLSKLDIPIYTVEGDAFVRHNGDRYCNRPLYCNHTYAVAFGGDKPYTMVGDAKSFLGNLMFALVRQGQGKWLQNASDITSKYRPGRMEWLVKDTTWGTTTIHLEVVPAAEGAGLIARVRVENALPGDTLLWASGGFSNEKGSILWTMDMTSQNVKYILRGFDATDCENNKVLAQGGSWTLQAATGKSSASATGTCSTDTKSIVADAGAWKDPVALLASHGKDLPIACGTVALADNQDVYWGLRSSQTENAAAQKPLAEEFAAGMQRVTDVEKQVVVETPDPWLNAAVGASVNANDAHFRDGIYTHSGMRWGVALLGWRTVYGGTVFGWHDNVKTDAKNFISQQITESDKTTAHADPKASLSSQAPDSRMFGKGRIDFHHPHHYDMQSQFFDQIQHAWRWTGDPDLEKLLRPSLDLHCEYIKDCFDPSNLGIYESYANTWPTDDQWYNGGGTSEETAYAYASEKTALQLAQRAGDQADTKLHTANLERIRKGFFDLLWIPRLGYPGAYREQIGYKRLHESPWLYAIFCPIDAGLLDTEQAAQALQFSEWGLERVKMPYGGDQCWPSQWVPSIWSVREMWSGDNYQLALAYFQTGLADDGWKVLHGTFPQQMLYGKVPGDMGHPAGGTDFNDCNSMFARAVVEGLFGYIPDYPNKTVKIAPQFPSDWDHASINTPDVTINYKRSGVNIQFDVTLAQAGSLDVELPVSARSVQAVTVNGKPSKWALVPGFGRSIVKLAVPDSASASVEITCRDLLKTYPATYISGNSGDSVTLQAEDAKIVDFHDPQGALKNARVESGSIIGVLTTNAGDHLVFGLAEVGEAQQWRLFKLHVTDVPADKYIAHKTQVEVPANAHWNTVDIQPVLNGDIRTIYKQKYLSPRPNTCSLRLAVDGYSTWQMSGGGESRAPEISLNDVPSLADGKGHILAGKNVPFLWSNGNTNIAFTSQWDNWPKQISVPVNEAGEAVWFLLCGTTDPMEVRIANAELRLKYADGVVEKLEIVPPMNFWSLCPFGGVDYDYQRDGFALPKVPPTTVQLGKNCRGIVLPWRLRSGVALESVTLETLSQEVVIGLMGVTVMN